jgi:hypothetical protein
MRSGVASCDGSPPRRVDIVESVAHQQIVGDARYFDEDNNRLGRPSL